MIYKKVTDTDFSSAEILEKIDSLRKLKLSTKDISSIIATLYGVNKNDVYKLTI